MTLKTGQKAPQMRPDAFRTHRPTPTPETPFAGRICACGCGEVFTAKRWWQEFKSTEHRKAAWRQRKTFVSVQEDHEARIRALEEKLKHFEKED